MDASAALYASAEARFESVRHLERLTPARQPQLPTDGRFDAVRGATDPRTDAPLASQLLAQQQALAAREQELMRKEATLAHEQALLAQQKLQAQHAAQQASLRAEQ
eukprot:6033297-Prymnesium_polylepis.1